MTDKDGNITDTFTYDTYGKLTERTGTSEIIFLYNGRDGVVTDQNGLLYMRARYYSPDLKRFVNMDIIAGEVTDPVTLNRYAYANGNPVSNIDPFGLSAERGQTISQKQNEWLNQYDAIYVVDYSDYGLPVVGHSFLYLKDKNNKWFLTEFAGEYPWNAKISTLNVTKKSIISKLNQTPETLSFPVQKYDGIIQKTVIETVYIGGVQFVPIKGDFTESINLAKKYNNQNYGGYDLITNNCLHYVKEILEAGQIDDPYIDNAVQNSKTIVPKKYYDELYRTARQSIFVSSNPNYSF